MSVLGGNIFIHFLLRQLLVKSLILIVAQRNIPKQRTLSLAQSSSRKSQVELVGKKSVVSLLAIHELKPIICIAAPTTNTRETRQKPLTRPIAKLRPVTKQESLGEFIAVL